ncbi:MAG: ABC transporter permease, partial [Candidatus Sumerlaeota bacterium]|nr:ABC transporter permease [Candidatus Sumerlaeota bacterium]
MNLLQLSRILRLGIKNLMRYKLRAGLTILGIVFGVCSVVAMLSVGEGASQEIQAAIQRLGS